jgi:nucleotide-binding universal stress UspA family protein
MADEPRAPGGPILVPTDFSEHSRVALRWAARAAKAFETSVVLLHVVHDPAATPGYYQQVSPSGHIRSLEDAARERLDDFVASLAGEPDLMGLPELDVRLVVGLPATRILEVAETLGAQLIVMGSRGLTGIAHLMLGSKAQRVVQLSPIPVTIVKNGDAEVPE